ncbi:right-handed parallel beta-helix repeat-containing protein [Massilia sp. Mn16-1_5]|uniref:right-handed parallel beta-helix repeat-containing protein n=1 Tax=Massilia sp. Mn16-1_5 TaxID=2079199 RepID=UPI001B34FBA5|nr:right-handed parallel beta-helix repeat-containing protein [Massilia sp. Mn16-1_5]
MKWIAVLAAPLLLALAGAGAGLVYLQSKGATPRALAPYLLKRTSGHNAYIEDAGRVASSTLLALDRGKAAPYAPPPLILGAQPEGPAAPSGRERLVGSIDEARRAMAEAVPGEVITFLPGDYVLRSTVYASRPGSAAAPIVVRAARPGTVTIAVQANEGFTVTAPWWRFENLGLRGACRHDDYCNHAFHVVGGAHHFVARNNTISDFNAHFKINGNRSGFPDHGLIEANTLANTAPRKTSRPVTPIDLVAASDWTIRANLIHDFVKAWGDRISYGAFAKGAAERTVFERNMVLCEAALSGQPGQRIGLSFGGGGTGKRYCRDARCITEHAGGSMRANLVAGCSDVGIYLNSASGTQLVDNTVLDTAGVQVRFPTSSATLAGNLVDGPLRADEGGVLRGEDNLSTAIPWLYLGRHPQRSLFADPARLDLRWRDDAPQRNAGAPAPGLCESERGKQRAYGAFDEFKRCLGAARQSGTLAPGTAAGEPAVQ